MGLRLLLLGLANVLLGEVVCLLGARHGEVFSVVAKGWSLRGRDRQSASCLKRAILGVGSSH